MKRLDVFTEKARRFTEGRAAQERLEMSRLAVELAEKTNHVVADRGDAVNANNRNVGERFLVLGSEEQRVRGGCAV